MKLTFKIYEWGKVGKNIPYEHDEELETTTASVFEIMSDLWDAGFNVALIKTGKDEAILMAYKLV